MIIFALYHWQVTVMVAEHKKSMEMMSSYVNGSY